MSDVGRFFVMWAVLIVGFALISKYGPRLCERLADRVFARCNRLIYFNREYARPPPDPTATRWQRFQHQLGVCTPDRECYCRICHERCHG